MKSRNLTLVLALFATLTHGADYQRWPLSGADERIEKYRTGQVELEFRLPNGESPRALESVELELKKHAFVFGVSMGQSWALHERPDFSAYREHMQEIFNTVSLGFFWRKMEPRRGDIRHINYLDDDIRWAQENGMSIKGTHLLWHNSLPRWLDQVKSPAQIERQITKHIRHLLETYPQVATWNAYNEVLGATKKNAPNNAITRWVSWKGGPEAAQAFVLNEARRINPNLRYINNHFNHADPQFVELNKQLARLGTPADIIGIQTHLHTQDRVLDETRMWGFLEEYAQLGTPVQLTEVSIPSSKLFANANALKPHLAELRKAGKSAWMKNSRPSTPELETRQAEYLQDFYTLAFSHPAVEGITYWSGSDLFEWRGSASGLIATDGRLKPAFHALRALIKKKWHTSVQSSSPVNGRLSFRGYYGSYQGQVTTESGSTSFAFCHSPDHGQHRVIVIGQDASPEQC